MQCNRLLLALGLGAILLAGCNREQKRRVAVIPKGTAHVFWQTVHAGAVAAGQEFKLEILWDGPPNETDYSRQLEIFDSMMNKHVDGIVVAAADKTILNASLDRAAKASVPVVVFDSGLDSTNYVSFVATNNYQAGQLGARQLAKLIGGKGRILATDILPMDSLVNVDFIQGDFTDEAIVQQLLDWLGEGKFDLIISDIAPNVSGISISDQAKSIYFLELALDTVCKTLRPGATFVAKMFQGSGSDQYIKQLRPHFGKVSIRKPAASRKESREVYLVAKDFKE